MARKTERKTISGTVARYGRVSTTMAGLAAKLAGERYLGIKIERAEHAAQLQKALGGLKGPLMKVGQILSTIPEALPPEYARALGELQANAPPMGWPFVRRRMKTELGSDWEKKFKTFGKEASAAASLGQVHKAVLHDGRKVACKLQYPDMRTAISADLSQLKIIFSIYERYDTAIKTEYLQDELAARLYEELDYTLEARHCKLYAHMLADEKGVHVPEVVDELSTDRLLTATWMEGERILNFKDAPQKVRNRLALNMFRAWYVPLYHYGVIHGDPHLGNYTVREDESINLLDFGCVRTFRAEFVGGVIELYHALIEDDRDRAVEAFRNWGFKNLNKEQIDALVTWARFLYSPLLDDKARLIGEAKDGMYGRETAHEVHQRLRTAGGSVTVPREFVFMDRAALGLGSVFIHLRAEINWHRLFNEMIEGFDPEKMKKKQKKALTQFGVALPE